LGLPRGAATSSTRPPSPRRTSRDLTSWRIFAGEGGGLFFVQTEEAAEDEIVGGAVIGLAEFGEQAFAEGHVKSRWR